MVKRILLVAIVVAAILVVAAPAMAFNGYRDDFTPTATCQMCHSGAFPGVPAVYNEWLETAHGAHLQSSAIARGPGCALCHVSNYAPAKHIPVAAGGAFPNAVDPASTENAFSETKVGCSTCHWNQSTAHGIPVTEMANADICGQCHARYSNTVRDYATWTWPSASLSPVAGTTKLQGTVGDFNPLGTPGATATDRWVAAGPISEFLSIPVVGAPQRGLVWPTGQSASAHGEGAVQYNEWAMEGHADALDALKAIGQGSNPRCLECHSTDYALAEEAGTPIIAPAAAKYGITCVGCHKPHEEGAQTSVWNEAKNPQLKAPRQQLCVQCHNAELAPQADGSPGVATPGSAVHHPMKEMMNGTGAIDVPQSSPSVHKGKCVQCHMVPTGYEHTGAAGTAGNHLFAIIEPEQAKTTTVNLGANGIKPMPYSSCTTCHSRPGDDQAEWLQDTLTNRQEAMANWDAQVDKALATAATLLGYEGADEAALISAANTAINAKAMSTWTAHELAFQKAFTNQQFVESEGSMGIHNWEYARTVVLKALEQAKSVKAAPKPWRITFKISKARVAVNHKVKFSGTVKTSAMVPGAGRVTIQKKVKGHWKAWRTATLNSTGAFAKRVKMTKRGTFYFRAFKPADASNLKKASRSRRLVVK